jgi:hypothetical protein
VKPLLSVFHEKSKNYLVEKMFSEVSETILNFAKKTVLGLIFANIFAIFEFEYGWDIQIRKHWFSKL